MRALIIAAAALALCACRQQEHVDTMATTVSYTAPSQDKHDLAARLHNMTMSQVRGVLGTPAASDDGDYGTRVWTYYNPPARDTESGAPVGSMEVHFAPSDIPGQLTVEYVAY